jgi:hypothetical protein
MYEHFLGSNKGFEILVNFGQDPLDSLRPRCILFSIFLMNNTLRRACTRVYVGNISEKAFTLCVNTIVPPYGSLIRKKWFSGHISMSWFDSQLQLLRYCHWKLKKSRLNASLPNLLAVCQLVSNDACCLHSEVRLLFLLHF